jgi:hypothetical protein
MAGQDSMAASSDFTQDAAPQFDEAMGDVGSGALASVANVGGYIDYAIVRTRFSLLGEYAQGGNSDRGEFLYGTYNGAGNPNNQGWALLNGSPAGPNQILVQNLRYWQVSGRVEYAFTDRFSAFAELPVRWNDIDGLPLTPAGNLQSSGLADMNAGIRYGIVNTGGNFLTGQLKVFAPTGDPATALGTGHASIQPGVLAQKNYDRLRVFGELHDWIALGGSTVVGGTFNGQNFAGNVLRYGLGAGYDIARYEDRTLTLVGEAVGWTVLDGLRTDVIIPDPAFPALAGSAAVADASGDTIINLKLGVRYSWGNHTLYAGYGFPLTDDRWYSDIIRVNYSYLGW